MVMGLGRRIMVQLKDWVMGKKKGKSKNVSNEQKQLTSEGKTKKALKPVAKITKTPVQNKADVKDPKLNASSEKGSLKKNNENDSSEKNVVEADVKGQTEDNTGADQKDKNKGNQKDEKKGNQNNKIKDNQKDKKDAKTKERDQPDKTVGDKLGGLIFMCNAKTKPDCYHYMVMGLPDSRKELVMRVKPGLKLFLYDYDLKLLYGVYKATCSGGIRLERAAFGGSFPAQVRFKVDRDCRPLPISEFRNSLKEIFDAKKNMFKVDLSVQQAQTLVSLFTMAPVHPKEQPVGQPLQFPIVPFAPAAPIVPLQGPLLVHHVHAPEAGLPPPRETAPRDPVPLTEKDYRTFGLQPQRTAPAPVPPPMSIPLTSGPADLQHGRPDIYYSRPYDVPAIPDSRIAPRGDSTYSVEANRAGNRLSYSDPYSHYDSVHSRLPEYGSRITEGPRAYKSESLHSAYAATALSDYNRRQQQPGSSYDIESLPVSSRYAFAGPTLTSYR